MLYHSQTAGTAALLSIRSHPKTRGRSPVPASCGLSAVADPRPRRAWGRAPGPLPPGGGAARRAALAAGPGAGCPCGHTLAGIGPGLSPRPCSRRRTRCRRRSSRRCRRGCRPGREAAARAGRPGGPPAGTASRSRRRRPSAVRPCRP